MRARAFISHTLMHELMHVAEGGLPLSRMLEQLKEPLGLFGMGKTSHYALSYHLQVAKRYAPIPKIVSCDSCRRGSNLEQALVAYEKRMAAHGDERPPCVVTRKELSRQHKQILFLDEEVEDYRLPIERIPELPRPGEHTCVVLWLCFITPQRPDAQEALLRLLRSIIRMLHRFIRILLAYLRRVFEALAFRLMVLAARLRYGYRHDGDDDLRSPLLRHYLRSARRVSVV